MLARFFSLWRALRHRPQQDHDLDDEIRFHIEARADDLVRTGLARATALRQARLEFGALDKSKEACRESRRVNWLEDLVQDIRFALRMLRKSPGFTLAIILTLALGVGANVTMSGVVEMLLFRVPEHLRQPEEIMRVDAVDKTGQPQMELANYPGFRRISEHSQLLQLAAQSFPFATDYGRGSGAREIQRNYITHAYFDVLGTQLLMGRPFSAEEETRPGGAPVAILGYDFWKQELGSDPNILGRNVWISGRQHTVIGITPLGFTGLDPGAVDVWLPISDSASRPGKNPITDTGMWWLQVIGRPVRGATREQAEAEATSAFQHTGGNPAQTIRLEPYLATRTKDPSKEARVSLWLMGVAFLVFLIACANVTNLFLVRVMQRRQEMAVRLQLGATRNRLIRQILVESLLVSLVGGTAALSLVYWARPLVLTFLLPPNFYEGDSLSRGMMVLTACLAVAAGLGSGLWPAWKASRVESLQTLKSSGRALQERSTARSILLVAQVALTLLLTVGAALFVRSLRSVHAIQLGFDAPHVLVATMAYSGYKPEDINAAYARMLERAEAVPGVKGAALASSVPFYGYGIASVGVAATNSSPAHEVSTGVNSVSPDYFAAMGMRILQGRSFAPTDRTGAPLVVIVNESLAKEVAPDGDAVGKYIEGESKEPNAREYTRHSLQIVGVVPDERRMWLFDDMPGQPKASVYTSLAQPEVIMPPNLGGLVIRTAGSPSALEERVASALETVALGSRYVTVRPITEKIDEQTLPWRMGASMFMLFGVLALALAAIGIYGLLAFLVRYRTSEIGLRLAFGAMPRDIVTLVLTRGMLLVFTGIVIGSGVAFGLARLMQSLLFGVAPADLTSYMLASSVVLLVALTACYIPARRAMRVDPVVALRHE